MSDVATTPAGINAQPRTEADSKLNWQRLATYLVGDGLALAAQGQLTVTPGDGIKIDGNKAVAAHLEAAGGLEIGGAGGIQINYAFIVGEQFAGNAVAVAFTLAHTPLSGSAAVYLSGLRKLRGTDYTISGATVTFTVAPGLAAVILVDYRYAV